MLSRVLKLALLTSVALFASSSSYSGTVTGTIRNGTNGKPGANLDVILIQLQGGMQPVATVKSDAQGRFTISNAAIGSGPMLIRVPFRGVNYHTPLPPSTPTVAVEIFDPTDKVSAISVTQHDVVFQPSGSNLMIGEEFSIENDTQPPVAYYQDSGTFSFMIPKSAQLQQVSAWSSSGMPVVQATMDKGNGQSAIAFAFRPGKNGVRIAYQMPYPSNQATVEMVSPYASKEVLLVAPPQVQVNAAGFANGGQQEGWAIYGRESVPPNTPLQVSLSGTAPPPADANGNGGGGSDNPSVNSRASDTTEAVATFPGRLDSLRWILVGGFAAIFALGVVYLWRRPQSAVAVGDSVAIAAPASSPRSPRAATAPAAPKNTPLAAEVESQVHGSLDDLKEKLFRLELRHQAGTISDEDYSAQRAQFEQTLRDFVRG